MKMRKREQILLRKNTVQVVVATLYVAQIILMQIMTGKG